MTGARRGHAVQLVEDGPRWRRRVRAQKRHWTKLQVRRHLRLLDARLGHLPPLQEYRDLCCREKGLPPAEEVLRLYGSWPAARAAIVAARRVPDVRALHREYSEGASLKELSEEHGLSHKRMVNAFRESGLALHKRPRAGSVRKEGSDQARGTSA